MIAASPLIARLSRHAIQASGRIADQLTKKAWTDDERANGRMVSWEMVRLAEWPDLQAYWEAQGWSLTVPHPIEDKTMGVSRAVFQVRNDSGALS